MSCLALLLCIVLAMSTVNASRRYKRVQYDVAEYLYQLKMADIKHITIRHTDTYMRNTPSANKELFNGCPLIVEELWKHNLHVEECPLKLKITVFKE